MSPVSTCPLGWGRQKAETLARVGGFQRRRIHTSLSRVRPGEAADLRRKSEARLSPEQALTEAERRLREGCEGGLAR